MFAVVCLLWFQFSWKFNSTQALPFPIPLCWENDKNQNFWVREARTIYMNAAMTQKKWTATILTTNLYKTEGAFHTKRCSPLQQLCRATETKTKGRTLLEPALRGLLRQRRKWRILPQLVFPFPEPETMKTNNTEILQIDLSVPCCFRTAHTTHSTPRSSLWDQCKCLVGLSWA